MDNNTTHGTWKTVRFTCGDGRLQRALLDYAEKEFEGLSDPVPAPGGVKKFLEDEGYRKKVLEDIATYIRLHNPPTILVIQHEDCGAYGGSKAFVGGSEELEFQERQLQAAVPILEREFPDRKVIPAFIGLDGHVLML